MEWVTFWRIVEAARAEAGSDTEQVARVLLRSLQDLSPDELEDFQVLWEQAQNELYCWPVHDAAELLLGPLDDDGLLAVQDWIVSHGRGVVQRVREDPDNLVDLMPDRRNARIDWFCGLAMEACIATTGCSLSVDGPEGPDEPVGAAAELTDEVSMRQRFPRVMAYLDENTWIRRPWDYTAD